MVSNYLDLIQRFWEYNEEKPLGSTPLLIYFYLLKLGYDQNSYSVSVSDIRVAKELGLTRKTVKVTKEKLQNSGVIKYVTKNGLACTYTIIPDYFYQTTESAITLQDTARGNDHLMHSVEQIEVKPTRSIVRKTGKFKQKTEEPTPVGLCNGNSVAIPSLEEFFNYVRTLPFYEPSLDERVRLKYDNWIKNDWKNNFDRPISDWKSTIKNSLPYLKHSARKNSAPVQLIPNIKRFIIKSNSEE